MTWIFHFQGTTLTLMMCWGFPIFLAAADCKFISTLISFPLTIPLITVVMILRVHAMWNQSKWILSALLFIYVPQVILSFVFSGIYYNPNTFLSVTIAHVIDFSFCAGSSIPTPLQLGLSIPRFILATVLLVFAIIPTLTQSVEMYTVTKVWQPSKIMQKLVKDGIVYFLVNMLYNTHDIIVNGSTLNATSVLFLGMFSCVAICPIMPRFIISIRELHDRERRGNWMDTGFNLLSQLASEDATVCASQIANGAEDDPEATRLDILGDNTQQV
ncbi:hypothetical protein OG21DRAFT_100651 [Imleria badia]|nr:hypothetical protein OG21DRAFT_100651 [Imleria badia]